MSTYAWKIISESVVPYSFALSVARDLESAQLRIGELEEVIFDKRRLTREIDVILNGVAGAAKQASLCDLMGQIKETVGQRDYVQQQCAGMRRFVEKITQTSMGHYDDCACMCMPAVECDCRYERDLKEALSTPSHGWVKAEVVKGMMEALERLMNYRDDGEGREFMKATTAAEQALSAAQAELEGK